MKTTVGILFWIGIVVIFLLAPIAQAVDAHYDYIRTDCTVKGNRAEIDVSIKITIENERGMDYNSILLAEDHFNNLADVKVRVIGPDGKLIRKYKLADFRKFCGYGASYTIFADNCQYYLEAEYPHYPFSIEYEYTTRTESLFYIRGAQFQSKIPVDSISYRLTYPDDIGFKKKIVGNRIEYDTYSEKGNNVFVCSATNLPAIKKCSYCPAEYPPVDQVLIQADHFDFAGITFDNLSWRGIGNWYRELAEDCYLDGNAIGELYPDSLGLTKALVKMIYNEVNDATRYVNISIREGGWKPHLADKVRELGYGDCKDLSTLLISQLRNAGFEAYPVLVLTRDVGRMELDFPNFGFNHLITMVIAEGDTLWLDPTCDLCPYDDLPQMDEDINVLVVTDSGGVIVRTPASTGDDNRYIKETDLLIEKSGRLTLQSRLTYTGNYARRLRHRIAGKDDDEIVAFCRNMFVGGEIEYELLNWEILNEHDKTEPLIFNLEAVKKKPIDKLNKVYYLQSDLYGLYESYKTIDISKREYPLDLSYPGYYNHRYHIRWDSSMTIDSIVLPESDTCNFDFCNLKTDYKNNDSALIVDFYKVELEYEVPTDLFDQFENYCEKQKEIRSAYIKLYSH